MYGNGKSQAVEPQFLLATSAATAEVIQPTSAKRISSGCHRRRRRQVRVHVYLSVGGTLVGRTCMGSDTKQNARSCCPSYVFTSTLKESEKNTPCERTVVTPAPVASHPCCCASTAVTTSPSTQIIRDDCPKSANVHSGRSWSSWALVATKKWRTYQHFSRYRYCIRATACEVFFFEAGTTPYRSNRENTCLAPNK